MLLTSKWRIRIERLEERVERLEERIEDNHKGICKTISESSVTECEKCGCLIQKKKENKLESTVGVKGSS